MKRACVIGFPIAHSRSPLIHRYWLQQYGIDGAYTKEVVKPVDLQGFLASLQQNGFAGCNVTVPHKEAAFSAASYRDASAVAVGAANTLWIEDGSLACANTDTYGFIANLDASAQEWKRVSGTPLVLGAGGSARAVIYGFIEAGMRDITVCNRSFERAQAIAEHFGEAVRARPWDDRNVAASDASVIVNTTTLGMNGNGDLGMDFAKAKRGAIAADLVYVPLETQFLKEAQAHGLIAVGGLGMLLHQAVPGFEKWFGVRPDVTRELYDLVAKDIGGS